MGNTTQSHDVYKMLSIALLCLFTGVGIGYFVATHPITVLQSQGCTMDAKICPDGSAVGRTDPKCEFAPCPSATTLPTLMTPNTEHGNIFSKRLADTNAFFTEKISYPAEMITLTDSELMGISCSKHFDGDNNGKFFSYTENSSQIPMTDPILLQVARLKPDASAMMQCTTEGGQTVILYENFSGGGGSNTVSYFALWSKAGTLSDIANIPNDGAPYFTCSRPYMLTIRNILYWGCGGGDGGFGQSSIYAIDLNKSSARRLIKCTSTADSDLAEPIGTSTVKCE